MGGVDLNPTIYSCTYSGAFMRFLSLKKFVFVLIAAAILYFGWAYVEAILLILPIPDPKDMKEKIKSWFSAAKKITSGKK